MILELTFNTLIRLKVFGYCGSRWGRYFINNV